MIRRHLSCGYAQLDMCCSKDKKLRQDFSPRPSRNAGGTVSADADDRKIEILLCIFKKPGKIYRGDSAWF